jgi:hypothetical protein
MSPQEAADRLLRLMGDPLLPKEVFDDLMQRYQELKKADQ